MQQAGDGLGEKVNGGDNGGRRWQRQMQEDAMADGNGKKTVEAWKKELNDLSKSQEFETLLTEALKCISEHPEETAGYFYSGYACTELAKLNQAAEYLNDALVVSNRKAIQNPDDEIHIKNHNATRHQLDYVDYRIKELQHNLAHIKSVDQIKSKYETFHPKELIKRYEDRIAEIQRELNGTRPKVKHSSDTDDATKETATTRNCS